MFLLEYIDPFFFLLALCVGLFYTYISVPQPQIVIKYPTPFNAGKVTYADRNNVCYKYKVSTVECPTDKSLIKKYKFQ